MKSNYLASVALTLAALSLAPAHAGVAEQNAATAAAAQQTLQAEMGDLAKDLTVAVDTQGIANLDGWAKGPKQVDQARYIVSKVPGVTQAYSSGVLTWSTSDRY